eukprot:1558664-Rhodomonas_salina.6
MSVPDIAWAAGTLEREASTTGHTPRYGTKSAVGHAEYTTPYQDTGAVDSTWWGPSHRDRECDYYALVGPYTIVSTAALLPAATENATVRIRFRSSAYSLGRSTGTERPLGWR